MAIKTLHFHGPFRFSKWGNYLFSSEYAMNEGIYIWAVMDETIGINYVHDIGETVSFAKRHREHLIQITGLVMDEDIAGIDKELII